MHGKVAAHRQLVAVLHHSGAGGGGGGELGGVKERIGLEVVVAGRFAGVHGADVDGGRHGGLGHVGLVVDKGGSHLAEAAMHVGDAAVPDAEADSTVGRIGRPGG